MSDLTKVAVIDRQGFFIEAVMAVLKQQPDLDIVASATIYEDFVEEASEAEIIVLQQETVALTRELIEMIAEELPGTELIVLGASNDCDVLISFIECGAIGYVREDEDFDQLLQVIRVVRSGQALAHPELIAPMFRRLGELGQMWRELYPVASGDVALTDRQKEVVKLLVQGQSNAEIAEKLDISVGTVKNHVHKIFGRLGVSSREQAAVVYERLDGNSQDGKTPSK